MAYAHARELAVVRPKSAAIVANSAISPHCAHVAQDVSMVGFDDLPAAADMDLTTVRVPHEELGRTAVR